MPSQLAREKRDSHDGRIPSNSRDDDDGLPSHGQLLGRFEIAGQPGHWHADALSHAPTIAAGVAILLRLELHPGPAMKKAAICVAVRFEYPGRRRGILR